MEKARKIYELITYYLVQPFNLEHVQQLFDN